LPTNGTISQSVDVIGTRPKTLMVAVLFFASLATETRASRVWKMGLEIPDFITPS
jgi:hypothetical protein